MSKKFKTLATIFFTCCYVFCVGLLVWQALTPGSESANISQNFGDQLNNALTNITKPVTEKIKVSSVEINSVTFHGEALEIRIDGSSGDKYVVVSVGSNVKILSQVKPSNANNPSVSYSLDNDEIASINQNGLLDAKGEGECKVTVTTNEGAFTDTLLIKIVTVEVESIEIVNKIDSLFIGQTHLAKVAFTPQNASDRNLIWSVSNESVLSIDEKGKIEALAEGNATVYAKCEQNQEILDSFEIAVSQKPDESNPENHIITLTSIDIVGEKQLTLKRGDTYSATITYTPTDATYKTINWASSDEKVATISSLGQIIALTKGECIITATSNTYSNISVQISVKVEERLTSQIVLSPSGITSDQHTVQHIIKVGKSAKIDADIDDNATVKTVNFISSNKDIATVSPDGVVNAIAPGKVTITAYSTDGVNRVESSIEITVERVDFKDTISNFYHWVRKSFGHFGAFLVLGIFASFMFICFSKSGIVKKAIIFAICMVSGFAVAGLTEILQLPIFTQGRYCSFTDVLIDFTGYSVAALCIFAVVFAIEIIKIIRFKRMQKNN